MLARLTYDALPGRVVFGVGGRNELPVEVDRLGSSRVLVIDGLIDGSIAAEIAQGLGDRHVGTIAGVRQHVPQELVASALDTTEGTGADLVVALGGGSAIGLAKALALETRLPIVALPTTYAGSEMTPIWGITKESRKTTGYDLVVLPRVVIYDPELTVSLPVGASAASGMNAIAHCVEAMWTASANPISDAVAAQGIALLARGLRSVVADPSDMAARSLALRGAWLGGTALAIAGTALHHKICHVLGGTFDLPHAEVHAVVLPWVVDHFAEVAPDALNQVARALEESDAVAGLQHLAGQLGLSAGLADLGFDQTGVEMAAQLIASIAPDYPAPVSSAEVRRILMNAIGDGASPGSASREQKEEQSCLTE